MCFGSDGRVDWQDLMCPLFIYIMVAQAFCENSRVSLITCNSLFVRSLPPSPALPYVFHSSVILLVLSFVWNLHSQMSQNGTAVFNYISKKSFYRSLTKSVQIDVLLFGGLFFRDILCQFFLSAYKVNDMAAPRFRPRLFLHLHSLPPSFPGNPITSSGKRKQLVIMTSIVMIPVVVLTGLTANTFFGTVSLYLSSSDIRAILLYRCVCSAALYVRLRCFNEQWNLRKRMGLLTAPVRAGLART